MYYINNTYSYDTKRVNSTLPMVFPAIKCGIILISQYYSNFSTKAVLLWCTENESIQNYLLEQFKVQNVPNITAQFKRMILVLDLTLNLET